MHTRAWHRVQQEIRAAKRESNPTEAPLAPAVRVQPEEVKTVATKAQLAALKKARAALQEKYGTTNIQEIRQMNPKGKKKGKKAAKAAKKASKPRKARRSTKQKAAARRNIKKAQAALRSKASKPRKSRKGKSRKSRKSRKAGRSSSRSSRSRSSSRSVRIEKTRVIQVPKARTQVIRLELKSKKRGKKRASRKKNPVDRDMGLLLRPPPGFEPRSQNPVEGLLSNAGPFSKESMQGFAVAAGGVGLGLVITDFLDRYLATRTPADSTQTGGAVLAGQRPWYGRDAAAAQRRRPDVVRLGGSAVLALAAMAGTYFTRNGRILPWLLGGTAVGSAAKLLENVLNWWVMPRVFGVDKPDEISFGNRMYPLEQAAVQDEAAKLFEAWADVPSLAEAQSESAETAVIKSPLASAGAGGVYGLGKGRQPSQLGAAPRAVAPAAGPKFVQTGRLGKCGTCGGVGGCWDSCGDYCGECNGGSKYTGPKAAVTVAAEEADITAMMNASQTDAGIVEGLNGVPAGRLGEIWKPGNRVIVPFQLGRFIEQRRARQGALGTPPPSPLPVASASAPTQVTSVEVIPTPSVPAPEPSPVSMDPESPMFQDAE